MNIISVLFYSSALTFFLFIIIKIIKLSKAPVHLRWELYPVPHEKGKSAYGGSKLEEYEWWTKEHQKDYFNEFYVMMKEIILLHGVWSHNKKLWFASFPLHLSFYSYIMFILSSSIILLFKATDINLLMNFLLSFSAVTCVISFITGIIGSLLLIYRRLIDEGLRKYSNISHFFNLSVFLLFYISMMLWYFNAEHFTLSFTVKLSQLFSFDITGIDYAAAVHLILLSFLLAYIPFTHMTHFFTKYFIYHKVRWDDEVNLPGSQMEKKISDYLKMEVSWAAPHISADGSKSWIALASEEKTREEKK